MPRNIRVHFLQGGGDMIVLVKSDSTTAHVLQAVANHIAVPDQSTLSYCIIGLGPFTAKEFVLVDIRALQLLSPNYPIDVIQSNIPQVENLPTPSHKRKWGADDEERGMVGARVGARVKAIKDEVGGGRGGGGRKFIKNEDDHGDRKGRVKVKTEHSGDDGRGTGHRVGGGRKEVIVISNSDD